MALAELTREDLLVLQPPRPRAVEELDHELRLRFAEVMPGLHTDVDELTLLQDSARFLDRRRAMAGIAEAIEIAGIRTVEEFGKRAKEIVDIARRLTRIDPIAVLLRDPDFVKFARRSAPDPDVTREIPEGLFENVVRGVRSLLEFCPIEELVLLGERVGKPDLGHRCRLSYDWLRAFVRRHTSPLNSVQMVVGPAYAGGRLTVQEVAKLLSLPIPDAVAWLEEHGYARDIKLIELEKSERERRLAGIREERLRRAGIPSPRPELVARDVIASQRIEDVDARPWVSDT